MWKVVIIVCVIPIFYFLRCAAVIVPFGQAPYKISLCDCVVATLKKYVDEKETITVASAITDYSKNVTTTIPLHQVLLIYLANEARWTMLTTNMVKYRKVILTPTLAKISKSYVIFIKGIGEISINLEKLKTLSSWNPHSFFFVVSATIFQNPFEVAEGILQTMWKEDLLEGAVFLANPKKPTVFNVYVPKPYVKGNCGKKLDQIELINSCTMGVFRKNKLLFKSNVPKRLNNCTMVVGITKIEPFVINISNHSSGRNEYHRTDGIEINLLNFIANYMDLSLVYYEGEPGEIFTNGTATGNLRRLKESKIDVAVGSYVKTFERCYYLDCSDTYVQDKLVWCVPHTPVLVYSYNFLDILDLPSWMLLILMFPIAVGLIWFVSVTNGKERTPYRDYKNVSQYVFSIFLGMPVRFHPRTFQIRAMFVAIVLFSFHLDSAYLSLLTSILTGSRYEESYGSRQEIYNRGLKTYFSPNTERYFQDERLQYVRDKMLICENYKDCMDGVAFRRDSAFCVGQVYVDYVYNSYVTKSNDPLLYCFGNIVSLKTNMLMRNGFPLFFKINDLIGRVLSSGLIAKWHRDILNTKVGNFMADIDVNEDAGPFLKFKNLKPVFKALVFGHCLAFVIFLVELIRGRK